MTTYGINAFGLGVGRRRFDTMTDIARRAEAAGVAAVWTSELYSRSATVPMAALAAGTDRITIGSNIAYGVGRSPLMWAAEARDLDELSGGRIILGLGNGTPKMMQAWHGVSGAAPAARMAELLTVLKALWGLHKGPVHHDGRFYSVHVAPTAEVPEPLRPEIPLWIAAVNKHMLQTAGAHADGLVGHPMFTADYVRGPVARELAVGAERVGRRADEVTIMGIRMCAIDDDVDRARRRVAFAIGQYAASRVYDRLFDLHGWGAQQQIIRQAAREGDLATMVASVSDEMIDEIAIACRPADLSAALGKLDGVFDHLDLVAPPWGLDEQETYAATEAILHGLAGHLGTGA